MLVRRLPWRSIRSSISTQPVSDLAAASECLRANGYAVLQLGDQGPETAHAAERAARTLMNITEDDGGKYNAGGGVTRPTVEGSGFLNAAEGAPANLRIQPHNEMAYAQQFPERVSFVMLRPAASGGLTEVYDNVQLTKLFETDLHGRHILRKMRNLGMWYTRLLHGIGSRGKTGFYSDWQSSFESEDFSEALQKANACPDAFAYSCDEAVCEQYSAADLEVPQMKAVSWAPAMVTHPEHGELVFSSILNRHATWQSGDTVFGALPLYARPYQCYWGDGSELSTEEVSHIRSAHDACKMELSLQRGDLLVLDNLYIQHGRAPFLPGPQPRLMGLMLGKMMQREPMRSTPPEAFALARQKALATMDSM